MKVAWSILLIFSIFTFQSKACFAADSSLTTTGKKVKIVAKSAAYGFGGGLIVGLASQAFKSKAKNIFVAGSLGLYAGIILGVIIVSGSHSSHYDGPDTYKDMDDFQTLKLSTPDKSNSVGQVDTKQKLQLPLFSANF